MGIQIPFLQKLSVFLITITILCVGCGPEKSDVNQEVAMELDSTWRVSSMIRYGEDLHELQLEGKTLILTKWSTTHMDSVAIQFIAERQ